jgi:LacI family transcriptional regulator
MANIYQVAERAGVSVATVSRIINNSGAVTDKTRQRVVTAMAELGYRPSSIAQALATNRTNCVGVLVSELHGPFFGDMLSALEQELRTAGKFVIVTAGHSDEAREKLGMQFLIGRNCDALIVHVEAISDQYLRDHDNKPAPLVVMNRMVPGLVDHCVTLDNEYGGYLATRHLLRKGHTRIAYISGPLSWHDASARLAGHKRALAEAGITPDNRLLVEGDYHETAGAAALGQLLDTGLPFTAIACGNDQMAAGVMAVARERGLRIPEQLSIVGFDNAPISRYLFPKLSTIDYPIADMGRMAARWVLRHVYDDQRIEAHRNFEPGLLERDSVASLDKREGAPAGARPAARRPHRKGKA